MGVGRWQGGGGVRETWLVIRVNPCGTAVWVVKYIEDVIGRQNTAYIIIYIFIYIYI